MIKTLWRWSAVKDDWEQIISMPAQLTKQVLRGYKRRDARGTRFRWTTGKKPRKVRRTK